MKKNNNVLHLAPFLDEYKHVFIEEVLIPRNRFLQAKSFSTDASLIELSELTLPDDTIASILKSNNGDEKKSLEIINDIMSVTKNVTEKNYQDIHHIMQNIF